MSQPVPACTQQPSRAPRRRSEKQCKSSFVPTRAARGLITGESRNLAVILPDITNPHFAAIVRSVEPSTRQRDLQVFLIGRAPGRAQRCPLLCRRRSSRSRRAASVSRVVLSCGRSMCLRSSVRRLASSSTTCPPRRRACDRPCTMSRWPPGGRGRTAGPPWRRRSRPACRRAADGGRRRAPGSPASRDWSGARRRCGRRGRRGADDRVEHDAAGGGQHGRRVVGQLRSTAPTRGPGRRPRRPPPRAPGRSCPSPRR